MRQGFGCVTARLCMFAGVVGISLIGCTDSDKQSSAVSSTPQQTFPVIDGFFAENHEIVLGSSTTLTAQFRNGTAIIDQGIGAVTSGTPVIIHPAETTTYTLNVLGGGKVVTHSLVVTMTKPVVPQNELGTLTQTGSLSATRSQHTATLLSSGKVLIMGGWGTDQCDEDRKYGCVHSRTTAEIYDPQTQNFIKTGRLVFERSGHTATLLPNGSVLIAGGTKTYGEASASAEIYNPFTGKFKATGNLISARSSHSATLLPDGKVLIAGGSGNILQSGRGEFDILASAELYDPESGKFTLAAGNLIVARSGHTATLLPNGKILLAGGVGKGSNNFLASAELYDIASGQFAATGDLTSKRVGHTATLLSNGKVLIGGGIAGDYQHFTLNTTELYDPVARTFSKAGDFAQERYSHTATLLPNGKVLIVAGSGKLGAINSVEVYDPFTDHSTPLDDIPFYARKEHTATLLQDGRVMIVGGNDYEFSLVDAIFYQQDTGHKLPVSTVGNRDSHNSAVRLGGASNVTAAPLSDN